MKLARRFLLACFAVAMLAPVTFAEDHKLSGENTTLKFVGSKSDGKHEGQFPKLEGNIAVDEADHSKTKLSLTIDMTALTSDDPKLTEHLKNADFFEVKKYPTAKFESKKVEVKAEHDYVVTGDLTMHGKTSSVTIPLKLEEKDGGHVLSGKWKIDRTKWGITYGKGKINDEVDLSVSIKLH